VQNKSTSIANRLRQDTNKYHSIATLVVNENFDTFVDIFYNKIIKECERASGLGHYYTNIYWSTLSHAAIDLLKPHGLTSLPDHSTTRILKPVEKRLVAEGFRITHHYWTIESRIYWGQSGPKPKVGIFRKFIRREATP
jgi:hypothetical protein